MKKLFITIAFVAATMFASAQLYVGGNLGINMGNTKSDSDVVDKTFAFEFNPSVGFMFNENMGVGADFIFSMNKDTHPQIGENPEGSIKINYFGIAPYFRYVFAEVDNFKFYADAKMNFESGKVDKDDDYHADPDSEWDNFADGSKITTLGFNIIPGMAYCFTDNISMNCQLNILSLGFNTQKITTPVPNEDDNVVKGTQFGFGVNYPTAITVGFFYTF